MQGTCNGVANGSNSNVPEGYYTNVYAATQTTNELSIWNAILSGSNITTNPSNYMITGGPNQYPSFSPPTLVVNASSSNLNPNSIVVNASFNPNTGHLSANSTGTANYSPDLPINSSPIPSATPGNIPPQALQTNPITTPPITWTISIPESGISYNTAGPNAGVYTLNQYCITNTNDTSNTTCAAPANGVQTINMTQCPRDSLVFVGDAIADSVQTPPTVNISLTCQPPPTPLTNVTLDYSACTNDQWASGGIYAAVTTPPNDAGTAGEVILACACVPSYLDGPQASSAPQANLLGGYVVGATSNSKSQKCPKPAT